MKTVILGAGLAGLELGRQLKMRGQDFVILEKEGQVGGLARTLRTGNYSWDLGVHALYSPWSQMTAFFHALPLDFQESQRHVKIVHSAGVRRCCLVDYPFEEGIRDLPWPAKLECFSGYLAARLRGKVAYQNLDDWIRRGLGPGIAKHFMIPYNSKIWNCPLNEISLDLVSAKIQPASVKNFILAATGKKVVGRAYQAKFVYPRQGIQALADWTASGFRDRIICNATVEKLERRQGRWSVISTQGREEADLVVSTIPLPELLCKVDVSGLAGEYAALRWNDTYFFMAGLKPGCRFGLIPDCHWAFFKEDEIFYRATLMQNFSRDFPPAIVVEMTSKGAEARWTRSEIEARILADLSRRGIVESRDDIAATDLQLVKYTYPIPTVGLPAVKEFVTKRLRDEKFFLLGRNGHWDYINMDGVFRAVAAFLDNEKIFPHG